MPPSPVKSHVVKNNSIIRPLVVTSLPDASTANDSDLFDQSNTALTDAPGTPQGSPFTSKDNSIGSLVGSLSEYDEDLLATLLALDDDSQNFIEKTKTEVPDPAMSSLPPSKSMQDEQPDPKLVEQLRQSLNNLPKSLQELFVERLVNVIASPEAFHSQVEAVSALAHVAAQEAKTHIDNMGHDDFRNNNEQSIQLATAALGSFLARYGALLQRNKITDNEKSSDSITQMET